MEFSNVRLLVSDFDTCFKFYSEKLGLKITWGKLGGEYASFDIGLKSEHMGLSIFKSDLMAQALGNSEKQLPVGFREKSVVIFKVDNVDTVYERLLNSGVEFINQPQDMTGWGMRAVHLYDPENNLIELWSELDMEKWDEDLKSEAEEYNS